jgi:DNA mismatch endonuclease (patch repair protein)
MSKIKKTDTKPELVVRRIVTQLGLRYRLHRRELPGCPDLVFVTRRKAIFVHGCFWHQHGCRLGAKQPISRREYWLPKLARNVERDGQAQTMLGEAGWDVLVVWECETKDEKWLVSRLRKFLFRFSRA